MLPWLYIGMLLLIFIWGMSGAYFDAKERE